MTREPRTEAGRRLVALILGSRRLRLLGRPKVEAAVRAVEVEARAEVFIMAERAIVASFAQEETTDV